MRDRDPGTITEYNAAQASSEWNSLRTREETMGDYGRVDKLVRTWELRRKPAIRNLLALPRSRSRRLALPPNGRSPKPPGSLYRANRRLATPGPGWGTGEATQEHSRTEEPEGARRRFRDIEKEQRTDAGLVTVVIPCYNQADFLGEPVESVLTQEKTSTIGRLTRPV